MGQHSDSDIKKAYFKVIEEIKGNTHKMKTCKCGNDTFFVTEKQASNGISHVGAYCTKCKTWLQWLPSQAVVEAKVQEGLTPIGDIAIPFGKFKGTKLKDLERSYLEWMANNLNDASWKLKVAKELDRRDGV